MASVTSQLFVSSTSNPKEPPKSKKIRFLHFPIQCLKLDSSCFPNLRTAKLTFDLHSKVIVYDVTECNFFVTVKFSDLLKTTVHANSVLITPTCKIFYTIRRQLDLKNLLGDTKDIVQVRFKSDFYFRNKKIPNFLECFLKDKQHSILLDSTKRSKLSERLQKAFDLASTQQPKPVRLATRQGVRSGEQRPTSASDSVSGVAGLLESDQYEQPDVQGLAQSDAADSAELAGPERLAHAAAHEQPNFPSPCKSSKMSNEHTPAIRSNLAPYCSTSATVQDHQMIVEMPSQHDKTVEILSPSPCVSANAQLLKEFKIELNQEWPLPCCKALKPIQLLLTGFTCVICGAEVRFSLCRNAIVYTKFVTHCVHKGKCLLFLEKCPICF